jgi:hypothetical protein
MQYIDNHRKFICVLNRNADRGALQNASLHAMIGLITKLHNVDRAADTEMLEYDVPGLPSVMLSTFPVIVLRSKNSSQMNTLRERAEATPGIASNYFTTSMNCGSAEEQRHRTRTTPIDQQEFLAVVLFGDSESLGPLTKKFSIYADEKLEMPASALAVPA